MRKNVRNRCVVVIFNKAEQNNSLLLALKPEDGGSTVLQNPINFIGLHGVTSQKIVPL
jgi:hypothetical protein